MKNKDAYYFPHDSNARNDYKLLRLRAKFGWEGYGIYFAIIEILREQSDYKLGKESSEAIATAIGKPFEWIQDFVNNLIQLGLLSREDGGGLYSESLINRMQQYEDRKMMLSEAGKKGAKIKKLKRLNRLKPPLSIKENKIKENKIINNELFENEEHLLQKFIKNNCPNISKLKEQLTFEEATRLFTDFTEQELQKVIEAMENYKPLTTKSISVNLTIRNWIRRDRQNGTNQKSSTRGSIDFNKWEREIKIAKGESTSMVSGAV